MLDEAIARRESLSLAEKLFGLPVTGYPHLVTVRLLRLPPAFLHAAYILWNDGVEVTASTAMHNSIILRAMFPYNQR